MYHLSRLARATPDIVAVHLLGTGAAWSSSQLEREANRAAHTLLSLGLKRHDCVALCIENSPGLLFLTLGAQRILTDRKDFVIISGGVNIYPQEIEDVLLQDARVADAAVFGVPNEEYGEEIKAVIQPAHPDFTGPAIAEALKSRCRELLGPIKVPRSIDFEFDFPRHATGKLYKKLLRDRYLKRP